MTDYTRIPVYRTSTGRFAVRVEPGKIEGVSYWHIIAQDAQGNRNYSMDGYSYYPDASFANVSDQYEYWAGVDGGMAVDVVRPRHDDPDQ